MPLPNPFNVSKVKRDELDPSTRRVLEKAERQVSNDTDAVNIEVTDLLDSKWKRAGGFRAWLAKILFRKI